MTKKKHGISPHSIDFLKNEIAGKLDRKIETHSDCAILSNELRELTGRSVGITTLRRFFGIDPSKNMPSIYTLDSLAIFCGYNSWDNFSNSRNHLNQNDLGMQLLRPLEEISWDLVKKEANEISDICLKALKTKSGLPFENTIPRNNINDFIEGFLNSDKYATSIIAPGGYGKTNALGHLIEQFWFADDCLYPDDIVWFIDAGMLNGLQAQKFDFADWFASQIGFGKKNNYRTFFRDHPEKRKGRLILIFDAVDKIINRKNRLQDIFDSIIDLIATNDDSPWFKMIFSMRNYSWNSFISTNRDYPNLKEKWYGVLFEVYNEGYTNLKQLSDDEIESLLDRNKGLINNANKFKNLKEIVFSGDLNDFISIPYYFQLLIQIANTGRNLPKSEVKLVIEFIRQNINSGVLAEEKNLIIDSIMAETGYGKKSYLVKKKKLIKQGVFKETSKAYIELLSYGIIREINKFNKFGTQTTYIEFSDYRLMAFLGALHYSEDNLTIAKIESVINIYKNSSLKVELIKWIIKIAFYHKNYRVIFSLKKILTKFKYLKHADRPKFWNEYWQIIKTVGFALRHDSKAREYLIPKFAADPDWRHWYFETFVDFDHLIKGFGDSINIYMRYDASNNSKIFGESLLLLKSIIEMNFDEASIHVENLNKFDHDPAFIHPILLARSLSYQLIYYYQKDGKTNEALLDKILRIEARIHEHYSSYEHIPLFHAIMMIGLNYTKRYDITVKFGSIIHEKYGNLLKKMNSPELEISKVLLADALLEAKRIEEADHYFKSYNPQLFRTTRKTYGIYYYMICSKISLYKNDFDGFIEYARKVSNLSRKHNYKIYEIMTRERTKSMIERFNLNSK
jgi:hypothetical protein